jgi:hypothetical protein
MGRRVCLYGDEWDAAHVRPSTLPADASSSELSVIITRLSDGLYQGGEVGWIGVVDR